MNKTDIQTSGTFLIRKVGTETYSCYIPPRLPINIDVDAFRPLLDESMLKLGRLDGMSVLLPDVSLYMYTYIRKEALLSSQIEGTQSTLSDVLVYEANGVPGVPIDDVNEVICYIDAINYALKRSEELPISLRLIKEIHGRLLNNSRGKDKNPGEFRSSQNWIGGSRPGNAIYIPPPPENLMECLDNLEKFIHDETYPILIKIAVFHAQFESIHPFLDGNGRIGRLLITFILCNNKVIQSPILYLSLFFKQNKDEYYNLLQNVRTRNNWKEWIKFFLEGVISVSESSILTAQHLKLLVDKDRKKINEVCNSLNIQQIFDFFSKKPVTTTDEIKRELKIEYRTILRNIYKLEQMGIIKELSGNDRNKIFFYEKYMEILNKEI